MKFLIVLAVAAVAQSTPIYPQDTPEVAAAKAEHLAEVQRAYAAAGVLFYPNLGYSSGVPVITPEGFVADTPEVAAAKAIHLAEKARIEAYNSPPAPAYSPPSPSYSPAAPLYSPPPPATSYYYPAPPAYSPAAPAYSPPANSYSYARSPYSYASSPYYNRSTGPFAVPVITPSGHLADTPEVAAAKAAHFAEVSRALAMVPRQYS